MSDKRSKTKLDSLDPNMLFTICLFEPMGAIYIPMLNTHLRLIQNKFSKIVYQLQQLQEVKDLYRYQYDDKNADAFYRIMLRKLRVMNITYAAQYMIDEFLDKGYKMSLSAEFHITLFDTIYKNQNLPEQVFNSAMNQMIENFWGDSEDLWQMIVYFLNKSPRYGNIKLDSDNKSPEALLKIITEYKRIFDEKKNSILFDYNNDIMCNFYAIIGLTSKDLNIDTTDMVNTIVGDYLNILFMNGEGEMLLEYLNYCALFSHRYLASPDLSNLEKFVKIYKIQLQVS